MNNLERILTSMRSAVVKFLEENTQEAKTSFTHVRDSSINSVTSVCRIFIPQLANLANDHGSSDENARRIVQFILGIKQLVRNVYATVAFTLLPQSCPQILLNRLKWAADTVLSIESFAGKEQSVPYEFKEFCGLLTVAKVQQSGSIASFRPPGSKFGLKRDSRKLHVEPLHLPPEESRTGTAGSAAAVASAANVGLFVDATSTTHTPEGRGRIEIKIDDILAATESSISSPSSSLREPSAKELVSSYSLSEIKSPSKYEEKGTYDSVNLFNGNIAARSIFARARAEGLLPGSRGVEDSKMAGIGLQRVPALQPGSACAPARPGVNSSATLDF